MSAPDFVTVTEVSGDEVTSEQVERLMRRYSWAAEYCREKDILEVGCGTAQGAGLLASIGRFVAAGDYSYPMLKAAHDHYGRRIPFVQLQAERLPFRDSAFDVVLILEAIYYVHDTGQFLGECRRLLRAGGSLLIAIANKDLFDFNPSPHSTEYYGVVELEKILREHGFSAEFAGDTPVGSVSARQQLLRPAKAVAAKLGVIPQSMHGKKLLKRLVFGRLVTMPPEIGPSPAPHVAPTPLPRGVPDRAHKVLFCVARRLD